MSFSSEVKEELSKLNNLANKEAVKYEFLGYLMANNITIEEFSKKSKVQEENHKLIFSTENEYNIGRFSKLLNNLNQTKYEIQIVGKTFSIKANAPILEEVEYKNGKASLNKEMIKSKTDKQETLQKAFIRGCFLGSGSMNDPKRSYHLEILFSDVENAKIALEILNSYNISLKQISKKQGESIYAKEGEEISKFLAFIGANNSVLKFEEVRVYREIRNNVNRKVNCETANLNKTVNSAIKQIQAIEYLKQKGKLQNLPEGLQEIAELRILHPEASLIELGTMLKTPIGKSGVNHRLKAIEKIAEDLKNQQ